MPMTIDPAAALTVGPPTPLAGRTLLVVLHGRGADETDLLPLVRALDTDSVPVLLRGPADLPPGFAWRNDGGSGAQASGLEPAAEAVLDWLDGLNATVPNRPDAVRLLGFSQGAAVAAQLLRLAPERFECAALLAGFVQSDPHPGDARLAEARPPVFWGRGDADDVIPAAAIAHAAAWLPRHTSLVERRYPGLGHGISAEEARDTAAFLMGHPRAE